MYCLFSFKRGLHSGKREPEVRISWASGPNIYTLVDFARTATTYFTIASLMLSTIYLTSSSVTYGPAGRQKPTLKSSSSMPLV